MRLPSADVLGMLFGLSELGLSLLKRSGDTARKADRSSLRVVWATVLASVALAIVASRRAPQWDSALLEHAYGAGVVLFALGIALRWYSILHLGRFFTVDVAIAADHRVVDDGPYRWVRHPSYSGAILAFAGYGICVGNWLSLALVVVPVSWAFVRRIEVEEEALTAALGEAYRAYAARTRRLVPGIY